MFTTRLATAADAALITAHRRAMFESMGNSQDSVLDTMSRAFEPWVRERLAAGKYVGWIVEHDGKVAASVGLMFLDWPPHRLHPSDDRRAYILNLFVEPQFRRRGLARELLKRCMEEAERLRIPVVTLHASDAGRPIYESRGFHSTSEMLYAEPV